MKKISFTIIFLYVISAALAGAHDPAYISASRVNGSFTLSAANQSAPIYASKTDYWGVLRALKDLQADITKVTNARPLLDSTGALPRAKQVIIVGTIGKNSLIDRLITAKKLNVSGIAGKWETFVIESIKNPYPGVDQALVIAGSDKRGTIYGIYDLSEQIGVSPWYYWADVPVKKQKSLYVLPGRHSSGTPKVKYRGIFLNDEAPALSGWTREKFGGFNHLFYEKVFELILRLKGNYLWPAMWGNAFNTDDKLNPILANEYGIVMGTSHHEPMDRAQQEWKLFGSGAWNYQTNAKVLQNFWRTGIKNMGTKETIVTVGMRGDGDMAMEEGTNIALLEKIVADQRSIIAKETAKKPEETPQLWALYKEVQDYYDRGMRVPDDITLLLCDDNWGNIRKLPKLNETQRKGGYGIYYHFDYVGGPRNYKWLNTNPIARVWEQMHLAYEYKARQIWIVNVGDLKPMEFPISFFLDYAWNPDKIKQNELQQYTRLWAKKQFGERHAAEIADIITKYTKYNGRRKPELLDQNTYSLTNYQEFETIVSDYNQLKAKAEVIYKNIPAEYADAYYQLVLHPVQACANLNEMYLAAAQNWLYAQQGRAATNDIAYRVKELFANDAKISAYYNNELGGGKWNHMMDQTHIGYTYWQQPPVDKMPDVKQLDIPNAADMAIMAEGSEAFWPNMLAKGKPVLPQFDFVQNDTHYIEVFNRGKESFNYNISTSAPWIRLSSLAGIIDKEQRITVSIDWQSAPKGISKSWVTINGAGHSVTVDVIANNTPAEGAGFIEADGYIAMEAAHYNKAFNQGNLHWVELPGHGRTLSAITLFPVTASVKTPGGTSPRLEYSINTDKTGEVTILAYVSPTIDFTNSNGLHYAISVDDEQPQIVSIHPDKSEAAWNRSVAENIKILTSKHSLTKAGKHILKFWAVDPGVVLQRLVVDCGGVKPSYLGPPESYRSK